MHDKKRCQIHTDMTLDEIHETHDALEEKTNDDRRKMCIEVHRRKEQGKGR